MSGSGRSVRRAVGHGVRRAAALAVGVSLALVPAAIAADGALDTSYGAGAATISVGSSFSNAWDIAMQGDDHAVLVGTANQGFPTWGFARLDTAGVLDPSFDGDGTFSKEVGNGGTAQAVVIDSERRILAGGDASGNGTVARPYLPRFALMRLTAGGTLDADFGTGGVVTTSVGGDPNATGVGGGVEALALAPGGKIVAGGYAFWSGKARFLIARYTSTGDLDLSFGGGDGMVDVPFAGGSDGVSALVVQPGGAIVVAGGAFDAVAGDTVFTLARVTSGGVLDGTFGTGGVVTTPMPGRGASGGAAAEALLQQADGGLVAAGWTSIDPGDRAFALARYSADGVLDPRFGTGGTTVTHVNSSEDAQGFAAHLSGDGTIVVAGEAQNAITGVKDVALARYTTGGQLDPSFGSAGLTTAGVVGTSGSARGIAAQSNGTYVIDGYRGGQFLAQRFFGPPAPVAPPPSTPTARPTPAAPGVAALPAFAGLVTLPGAKQCVSRKRFSIRLRVPRESAVTSAQVKVNGKRVAVRSGARLRSVVNLTKMPKGRFRVDVILKLADGRAVKGTRTYRTCAAKRRAGRGSRV